MKTFFLVPGFKMQFTDKPYAWLPKYIRNLGYKVIPVPVQWDYRTLTQNAQEFISFYQKHKSEENYVLGFSYGSVITILTANTLKPHKIFLCSLSPDFAEDSVAMKPREKKFIGKRRFADTATRSARALAKTLTVPVTVIYGEVEGKQYPQLKKRAEETAKLAHRSKLIMVKNAPHKISFPEYMEAIKKEIK